MNKYSREKLILFISGIILISVSCTPLACFEETESYLKASFYKQATDVLQAPDSITLYGAGKENSFLYKRAIKVQPVLFSLNPGTSSCTYIIKINGLTDTISFSYNVNPHLISRECGYTYYYTLNGVPEYTMNSIKFVSVTKGSITTLNEENIRIYY